MGQKQQNVRVIDDRHTAGEGPITAEEVAALDTLIKEVAEVSGVEARELKRRLLKYLRIADLTGLASRYAETTALLENKRDRATLDPATYRLRTMLALFEWAKEHQPNWKEGPPRSAAQAAVDREWWALEREELLAAGEFAEQLNRQNIGDQDKVTRIEKFLEQLEQQNADRHARLERKRKHDDEREHLDYIRNSIRQGVKGARN